MSEQQQPQAQQQQPQRQPLPTDEELSRQLLDEVSIWDARAQALAQQMLAEFQQESAKALAAVPALGF